MIQSSMREQCQYCSRANVVPVLDKRIEHHNRPGNAYRRFCLACERWLPMCSKEYYTSHPHPHVLPIGSDPEEGNIVELAEYDYEPELVALTDQERLQVEQKRDDLDFTTTSLDSRMRVLNSLVSASDEGENHNVNSTSQRITETSLPKNDDLELLRELKKLYDDTIITSSEFDEQKKKILERL